MKYIKLSNIIIKDSFANSIPSKDKIDECRRYYKLHNAQDRYIVIDHNNVLIDGYIQYLVLKENNVEGAKIRVSNKKKREYARINIERKIEKSTRKSYRERETAYVYGIHLNSQDTTERVWRAPNSWWIGWVNNLHIGDILLVHTKYGVAPIRVTKFDISNKCPVDVPVKTVVRKINDYKED